MSVGENSIGGMTFAPVKEEEKRSIWGLLRWFVYAAIAIVAIVAVIAIPQLILLGILAGHLCFAGLLMASTIYGKRWFRAFAIGALIPNLLASLVMIPFAIDGDMEFFGVLVIGFIASMIVGTASTLSHGFLARRDWDVPAPRFLRSVLDTK